MSNDFLSDRRRGVEEAFFARQNEELRLAMRSEAATPAELEAASGIHDKAVLDTLVHLDVGPEGAAALSLIPLVAVAWADGELDVKERDALLAAAEQGGLTRASAGYAMFETWLHDEPPPSLLTKWKTYVGALTASMPQDSRELFSREVLGKAQVMAEAAGGFLGIGKVSAAEEAVLDDLERTLRG